MHDKLLYYGQPINRGHPLNRGLIPDWTVVPWFKSGPRLIDLSGFRTHGTLMNAGTTWSGVSAISGWGSIAYDGAVGTGINIPLASYFPRTAGTFLARVYPTTTSAVRQIFMWRIDGSNELGIVDFNGNFGLNLGCQYNAGGTNKNVAAASLSQNVWHDVGFTWDAGTASVLRMYVDGAEVGTAATGLGTMSSSDPAYYKIGSSNNSGEEWSGNIADAHIWDRALSAAEILEFRAELRRGNPSRFNWISTRMYFGVTAGGGGNRRRRVLLGSR